MHFQRINKVFKITTDDIQNSQVDGLDIMAMRQNTAIFKRFEKVANVVMCSHQELPQEGAVQGCFTHLKQTGFN